MHAPSTAFGMYLMTVIIVYAYVMQDEMPDKRRWFDYPVAALVAFFWPGLLVIAVIADKSEDIKQALKSNKTKAFEEIQRLGDD